MRYVVCLVVGVLIGALCAMTVASVLGARNAWPRAVMTVMQHEFAGARRIHGVVTAQALETLHDFVDAYCLQHDPYIASFKSFAAHLAHLCWSLEHGGSRAVPSEPIRAWVERNPTVEKPPLPARRGVVTIADVAAAAHAPAHRMAVDLWARSVWDAYASLQPLARDWVSAALREKDVIRPH